MRVECTILGEVASYIEEIYTPAGLALLIQLDKPRIQLLNLEINADIVVKAILAKSSLKIKPAMVQVQSPFRIRISPPVLPKQAPYFSLKATKNALKLVLIKGFKSISRAIIVKMDKDADGNKLAREAPPQYKLMIEGTDMKAVISTRGKKYEEFSVDLF